MIIIGSNDNFNNDGYDYDNNNNNNNEWVRNNGKGLFYIHHILRNFFKISLSCLHIGLS
jgi:hypothetical protein